MHEEPKSMLRYVAIALILVAPVLYFISSHVDQKVAPVSAFVAQAVGVTASDQLAASDKAPINR